MTIAVVDASAVVDVLIGSDRAAHVRDQLGRAELLSVAHLDAEVFSALARLARAGELSATDVRARLDLLGELPVDRLPISVGLLGAAWALRGTIAARDALYVAAARALDAELISTDDRLVRAVADLRR